jgi:hypothetical protein
MSLTCIRTPCCGTGTLYLMHLCTSQTGHIFIETVSCASSIGPISAADPASVFEITRSPRTEITRSPLTEITRSPLTEITRSPRTESCFRLPTERKLGTEQWYHAGLSSRDALCSYSVRRALFLMFISLETSYSIADSSYDIGRDLPNSYLLVAELYLHCKI